MSGPIELHEAASAPAAGERLAARVADRLAERLAGGRRATLVVSGGRTPGPFFRALRERELDWPRVAVLLADERWVAPEHPDSNERLVRTELLAGRAAGAVFVPLRTEEDETPEAAAAAASERIAPLLPFDVVVLGMGTDGHTASLFPGAPGLDRALAPAPGPPGPCVAIDPPGPGYRRLSLTAGALGGAGLVCLHVTGADKRAVLERALEPGPAAELPVRAVLAGAGRPVEVYWAP